ncbi:MAG: hypothetical protein ACYC7D_03485 [Nitrososphaerales archaeon]
MHKQNSAWVVHSDERGDRADYSCQIQDGLDIPDFMVCLKRGYFALLIPSRVKGGPLIGDNMSKDTVNVILKDFNVPEFPSELTKH